MGVTVLCGNAQLKMANIQSYHLRFMTIKHILLEWIDYSDVRQKYF